MSIWEKNLDSEAQIKHAKKFLWVPVVGCILMIILLIMVDFSSIKQYVLDADAILLSMLIMFGLGFVILLMWIRTLYYVKKLEEQIKEIKNV